MVDAAELGISEQRLGEIDYLFKHFDRDESGTINCLELGKAVQGLGYNPTRAEVEEIIKEGDKNGSGVLEYKEFAEVMAKKLKDLEDVNPEQELLDAFKTFDKNDDGHVSASEFRETMLNKGDKLTEEEVDEMMASIGFEEGEQIEYKEFVRVMTATEA